MSNIPIKCIKCGAPIEIDPYKEFAKCLYCGTTNIIDNEKLSSRSNKVLDKFREYLPKLKEKKVYIPLIVFSILFPVAVYKANYIDDFLVKECQIRARQSNDGEFIAKKNYKKCLKTIKREWSNLVYSTCIDLKKYAAYMERPRYTGPTRNEEELEMLRKKYNNNCGKKVKAQARPNEGNCVKEYNINFAKYLTKKNIKMYSVYWSPYCKYQKEIFGEEAVKELNIIECEDKYFEKNSLCIDKGIVGYPSWEINGEMIIGSQTIEELAKKSSYEKSNCSDNKLKEEINCSQLLKDIDNQAAVVEYELLDDAYQESENKRKLFKKETLRVGAKWLKDNGVLTSYGTFSQFDCTKNLKKVPHLIFGRNKRLFE